MPAAHRVPVRRSYTLAELHQAFADLAAGKIGGLVVRIDWAATETRATADGRGATRGASAALRCTT